MGFIKHSDGKIISVVPVEDDELTDEQKETLKEISKKMAQQNKKHSDTSNKSGN